MPWRSKRRIADRHFLKSRGRYIFAMMRRYVKGRQELHGGTKKRYTGRQRWEMRHNLHVIKQHHTHRILKTHFQSWRTRAHQRAIVKRSFQGHINTLAVNVLKAWRLEAEKQIKIKSASLQSGDSTACHCIKPHFVHGMYLRKSRKRQILPGIHLSEPGIGVKFVPYCTKYSRFGGTKQCMAKLRECIHAWS